MGKVTGRSITIAGIVFALVAIIATIIGSILYYTSSRSSINLWNPFNLIGIGATIITLIAAFIVLFSMARERRMAQNRENNHLMEEITASILQLPPRQGQSALLTLSDLDKREKELELEKKSLEVQKERFEVEKERVDYALEAANRAIDTLSPKLDESTRDKFLDVLVRFLLTEQNQEATKRHEETA
jgi:uncharacterized membrane protein YcjF (UPF0283 family)